MNFCIYVILYSVETLVGSSSDKRVQGENFSLVGFLGQKVLSGGLGRVTPAVGFEGGEAAPLAVLRQSLSGVQRGHSGTQGLA